MSPDLSALVLALKFGELRVSQASYGSDESGLPIFRAGLVELRDLELQTTLGSLRAGVVELSELTVRRPRTQAAAVAGAVAGVSVERVHLKDARIEPAGGALTAVPTRRRVWRFEPLASLDGTLRAKIVDAAWIFDADVTIPVSEGCVDFNRATVEHVGPDSSMGLSRMGVYVDAPNGRTYLYLLSATHVPGARFEQRRGGLLRGWTGDRGAIELRPLLESLLAGLHTRGALASGMRDMLARTRVSGELRLGDGVIGDERNRLVLAGREPGRNHITLTSIASGSGIVLRVPDLSLKEVRWESAGAAFVARDLSGAASVEVVLEPKGLRVSVSVAELTVLDAGVEPSLKDG